MVANRDMLIFKRDNENLDINCQVSIKNENDTCNRKL